MLWLETPTPKGIMMDSICRGCEARKVIQEEKDRPADERCHDSIAVATLHCLDPCACVCPACDEGRTVGLKVAQLYGIDGNPYVTKVCDPCFNIVTGPGGSDGIRLKVTLDDLPETLARLSRYSLRFRCTPTYTDGFAPECTGIWMVLVLTDCREQIDAAIITPKGIHKNNCKAVYGGLCDGCF